MRRERTIGLALVAVIVAGVGISTFWHRHPRVPHMDPPTVDTTSMEPEVAARIASVRQEVLQSPDSAEAWAHLGMVLHAHKVEAAARVAYEHAIALKPDARWHYYCAKVLESAEPEAALKHAREAVRLAPESMPAHAETAYLLEQSGNIDGALAELAKIPPADVEPGIEFVRGRLLLAKGDADGAKEALVHALERQPGMGSAHGLLARAYRMKGDLEGAKRETDVSRGMPIGVTMTDPWMEAVDAEAVSLLGYVNKARRAEASGDLPTAERLYRHLIEIRPQDADVHYIVGEFYMRHQQMEARNEYLRAVALQPAHNMAHLRLGQFDESNGNLKGAIEHFRTAIGASPELAILHRALAEALDKSGNKVESEKEAALAEQLGGERR
jgi:tetratricopeptide (TPR) repeat protein